MRIEKTFFLGRHRVCVQTGELAGQATGAVRLELDETVVLATVVSAREPKPGMAFFPLTENYLERTYASSQIPRGMLRREGIGTEKETLTARFRGEYA